jgi:hypothetical protein
VSSAGRTQDSRLRSFARYLGFGLCRVSSGCLGLAIVWFWFCGLVLARLTTCSYHVDGQLNRARYLSRARFAGKIDHVTNRQELGGCPDGQGSVVRSLIGSRDRGSFLEVRNRSGNSEVARSGVGF